MPNHSVLYNHPNGRFDSQVIDAPPFFSDLNLDQVINAILVQKQDYDLRSFYYDAPHDVTTIRYRQDVFRDLENKVLQDQIRTFAEKMVVARRYLDLAGKLHYHYHQRGWFLESAAVYVAAVSDLVNGLSSIDMHSRALLDFRDAATRYVHSSPFVALAEDTHQRKSDLASVRYNIIIQGDTVRIRAYEDEVDYSHIVEETFAKFKQGGVKNYHIELPDPSGMNHIEAKILDYVAKLHPEIFAELDRYYKDHQSFFNPLIYTFDREIQFYLGYLEYITPIKHAGLSFCYPTVSDHDKAVSATSSFDLALANLCVSKGAPVIPNDFSLRNAERIIVVSGPNQGGKTTFARMFGQLHFLARLGCPVPGKEANLFLYDNLFTHFEEEEDITNLQGKLADDLIRIRHILEQATGDSVIIMNEIFNSTSFQDARFLSREIMGDMIRLDALGVCVSFIDELSNLGPQAISMVGTVVPDNPAQRTYKIIRQPADGLSYAIHIAEKHRLTYEAVKERIAP
ncbi:MAG: DNA mismatch repair protein MutS [Chloroflexota bacterium]